MISHGREAEHRNHLAIRRRGLVRARGWTQPRSLPDAGGSTRLAGAGHAGSDRSKGSPVPDDLGPPFQISAFLTGGRSFHPPAVVPRVLGWVWGNESYKGPGLTQHVIRRPTVPTQIPRPQPHGGAEPSAPGRAAVGPCRHLDLLRRLGAACGLVSARAPTTPLGLDWGLLCSWVKPEAPSLLPSFLTPQSPGSWSTSCRLRAGPGLQRRRGCSTSTWTRAQEGGVTA